MTEVFHRVGYAEELAKQLLSPSGLQTQVRSGLFLSGIRRVGKTTFIRQDLIPSLEVQGALVIYVDLWADRAKSPTLLVLDAGRRRLRSSLPRAGPMSCLSSTRYSRP